MAIGPVEYVIIKFPGNQFKGEIVPALADLVESGTVRILDLVFVLKDEDGNIASLEYEDLPGLADVDGEADGLLNEEDLEMAAEVLEPNSSGLLIVWEDRWARRGQALEAGLDDLVGDALAGHDHAAGVADGLGQRGGPPVLAATPP